MTGPAGIARVLHIHGTLAAGDPQAERCVRIMAALGGRLRHTVVAADGEFGALAALSPGIQAERRTDFPAVGGVPLPGRLQRIARAMVDYHLVLTYGRGAIGAALAHTAFSQVHGLPPLIHHDDGSDETAAQRRGWRSRWLRRVGLGKAAGLVVPSETMEHAALVDWQQPLGRVKRIADGVDVAGLGKKLGKGDAIPRLVKRPGECWIGCESNFAGSDNPMQLVAALATLDRAWHLVVVGNGPEEAAFRDRVAALSLDNRVHLVSRLPDVATLARLSDLVALVGGREPLPRLALIALAAGKPLVGFDGSVGEIANAAAAENAEFLVSPGNGAALENAIMHLAHDDRLRQRLGESNRVKAQAERSEAKMIAAYRRLYDSAIERGPR